MRIIDDEALRNELLKTFVWISAHQMLLSAFAANAIDVLINSATH